MAGAGPADDLSDQLLARYREKGEFFLDGLTGAFAVQLLDPARDLVAIACDGMGNRSLAYSLSANRLVCSPEAADLVETSSGAGFARPTGVLRWAEYFAYEELSGDETFFESVKTLLPGEMILFSKGAARRRWLPRPRLDLRTERAHWEDYVEEFAGLLEGSVLRCIAGLDRVAVLLSGGLDSTPIAALAARHLAPSRGRAAVTALSWRMSDPQGDESAYIRQAADHSGLQVEWVDCDDAMPFSDLPHWPVHPFDPGTDLLPLVSPAQLCPRRRAGKPRHPVWILRRCALHRRAQMGRDLLSAQGPGPAIDRLREVAAKIGWRRTLRSHIFGPLLPRRRGLRRELAPYLTESAQRSLGSRPRWPPEVATARRPRQAERLLALLDSHGAGVERHYTEAFGLEQRTPLRDFALVQFMLSVPDHLLQQGPETRPVLRAAVAGLIPEEIRRRRDKAYLSRVHDRGMESARLKWTRDLLLDPDALWHGYIEEPCVRSWVERSPVDNWGKLGYLQAIFAELWRRQRAGIPWPSAEAVD